MALEAASFIDGLVITNPPGTDDKRQGDDHIRLIKNVLKNTFPGATKAFPIPSSSTKTGDYAVVGADQNSFIMVNNGATATLTMPTLSSTDAGWQVTIIKLNTGFPLFIAPPSGNIISGQTIVAKARRSIPLVPFNVLWTGSNWVVERIAREPIGSVVPLFVSALPVGFEWPNGQVLVTTNYPEYTALRGNGSTPDLRQRTVFGTDLGGADTGRITSVISPTLDNVGGSQFMQSHAHGGITGFQDADHSHSGQTQGQNVGHSHTISGSFVTVGPGGLNIAGGATAFGLGALPSTDGVSNDHSHAFGTGGASANHRHGVNAEGSGGSQNMPPAIICNYALVVE